MPASLCYFCVDVYYVGYCVSLDGLAVGICGLHDDICVLNFITELPYSEEKRSPRDLTDFLLSRR